MLSPSAFKLSLNFSGLGSSFQLPTSSVTSLSIFSARPLLRLQMGISPIWLRFKFEQPTSPVSSSNPHFLTSTPSWVSTFQSGPTDWFPDFDFTDSKIFKQPLPVPWDCFTATLASWLSWFSSNRPQIALFLPPLASEPILFFYFLDCSTYFGYSFCQTFTYPLNWPEKY